jgi:hypothetical protein
LDVAHWLDEGRREVQVRWVGQPASSLLVVNFDYWWGNQRPGEGLAQVLYGPVLVRRIDESGAASIVVDEQQLSGRHAPGFRGVLNVLVVPRIMASSAVMRKDEPFKDVRHIIDERELTVNAFADHFSQIGTQNGALYGDALGEIPVKIIEVPQDGFVHVVVPRSVCGGTIKQWLKPAFDPEADDDGAVEE